MCSSTSLSQGYTVLFLDWTGAVVSFEGWIEEGSASMFTHMVVGW